MPQERKYANEYLWPANTKSPNYYLKKKTVQHCLKRVLCNDLMQTNPDGCLKQEQNKIKLHKYHMNKLNNIGYSCSLKFVDSLWGLEKALLFKITQFYLKNMV